MNVSMYQISIPRFVHMLGNLDAILGKAEAYAAAKKLDPATLPTARLYADMLPLTSQVQIACDAAKGAAARLAGTAIPAFDDDEKTLADLRGRVGKTVAYLNTVTAQQIDGSEGKSLTIKVGGNDKQYDGMTFLLGRALPNFYFHVATAYDILRHNGVEIGKRDYIGAV